MTTETLIEQDIPHNVEAEQAVLGAVFLDPAVLDDLAETLRPTDFYRPSHQGIYGAFGEMHANGVPVDPITTMDYLSKRGDLARVGGGAYLHTLLSGVPTATNVGHYARIVREEALRRRVKEAGIRLEVLGSSGEDVEVIMDRVAAEMDALGESRAKTDYLRLGEILPEALDAIEGYGNQASGTVRTGFADLDALTSGLHPHQLIVVGARPAIGKSTLGLDIARRVAKDGETVVVFSLEMSRQDIVTRLLSAEARVSMHKMRSGRMDDDDWGRVAKRLGEIAEVPLYIDDSPNLSMMEIWAKCRRLKQRCGLRVAVVDYLQLMRHGSARSDSREREISEISRGLKLMAKALDITVIAMSQLNRGPEQRTDKRPLVSDLRESGSIEQDADMVILLHREDAYDKESPRAGEADLIVAKHRNGPTATITVAFQGHYGRFVDMAPN